MDDKFKNEWLKIASCKTITSELLLSFILDQYKKAAKKSKAPLHTDFLIKLFQKICKWSKIKDSKRKTLKSAVDRKVMSIRIQANQRTKPARTYKPNVLLKLIQDQWNRPVHGAGKKAILRKYASAMALICFLTGRRWVDITRIKWDNLVSFTTPLGLFYKFYLPTSKTNIRGQRIECITLRNVNSNSLIGPIKMLESIRFWQGNPTHGFVFPCVAKTEFVIDPIWESWSSYRCQGHWVNKVRTECLGQIDGKSTIGVIQRFATKKGWKTVPTMHTFRRLVTLLHKRKGLSREQINELMGWVPTSNMPVHYAAEQDSLLESAPANIFASELEQKIPFEKYDNLQFEL